MAKKIFFVMGVSGCGKSSVGIQLSSLLSISYIDSDDLHPKSNVDKMRNGIPLNDEDRKPWLFAMNKLATECIEGEGRMIFASSCLKSVYRQVLQESIRESVLFIYLKGSFECISERMSARSEHYFTGDEMLKSQFLALEAPHSKEDIDYIEVSIDGNDVDAVVEDALEQMRMKGYI